MCLKKGGNACNHVDLSVIMSKRSKSHFNPPAIANCDKFPSTEMRYGYASTKDHSENEPTGLGPGDHEQSGTVYRGSPTLVQLQSRSKESRGSGGLVYTAQRELEKKHHHAKSRVHAGVSGIGGGVSLWPAMDDMRLSSSEVNWLVVVCGVLVIGTMSVFLACHGKYIHA